MCGLIGSMGYVLIQSFRLLGFFLSDAQIPEKGNFQFSLPCSSLIGCCDYGSLTSSSTEEGRTNSWQSLDLWSNDDRK